MQNKYDKICYNVEKYSNLVQGTVENVKNKLYLLFMLLWVCFSRIFYYKYLDNAIHPVIDIFAVAFSLLGH